MKFKLKRKEGTPTFRFSYKEYDVHRTLSSSKWGYMFYVLDDKGEKYYFNMLDGQIDDDNGHLDAKNWEVIRIKEEKEMKFKVGEVYKSNTANQLYKYVGKSNDLGYLNFEIVSGGSVGELEELSISYAEEFFELQDVDVEYHEGDVLRYCAYSNRFWTIGREYIVYKDENGLFLFDDTFPTNGDGAKRYITDTLRKNVLKYMAFTRSTMVDDGEEKAPEVPVFVKATLDEAITAFKEGNKSGFYMYNPKKGICTPLVEETNIRMLTTWTILKKVGE